MILSNFDSEKCSAKYSDIQGQLHTSKNALNHIRYRKKENEN